ncbi:MAG: two-component system response regulator CreB [Myxococcales bacterium]|nr:two-component system response regulator CreB [Myxococcales bacterium]
MTRVLLVEDERAIADTVLYALEKGRYQSDWCATGEAALEALARRPAELIVLDVGLPDCNGFDLLRRIRELTEVPVIFLTAWSDEVDRIIGLELGGDDYVTKPFSPRELVARIGAVLRRSSAAPKSPSDALSGSFVVDDERLEVFFGGEPLQLSLYEYRVLTLLIGRPGKVFSREEILQRAWEDPGMITDRTIDAHIKAIRRKIKEVDPAADPIRTVRGVGYALKPEGASG